MIGKKVKFWIWSPYSTVPGMAFVTELSGLSDEHRRKLYRGEKISPIPRIIIEDFDLGRFNDQLGAYIGLILVSPVLREVLEGIDSAKLQFIPADVRSKPNLRYFAVNALDTVSALDMNLSKYDIFSESGGISRIDKLVLRSIPSDAPPIFHVAEDTSLILVNDDVRRTLVTASKHPGILTPVDEYRNEF